MAKKTKLPPEDEITDDDIFEGVQAHPTPPPAPEPAPEPEEELEEEDLDAELEKAEKKKDTRPLVFKILSHEGELVEFELGNVGHGGICEVFRQNLLLDDRVLFAAYNFDYFNPPRFRLQLRDGRELTDVLLTAGKKMMETVEEFEKVMSQVLPES
ncbi:MAG: hypothetical protein Kow0069_08380 [Promethearchaeota archaeon]